MMSTIFDLSLYAFAVVGLVSFGSYLAVVLAQVLAGPQNLKKKYAADWALVTGGSSGIGLAIAEKLADQGVNVVLVALDDALLHSSHLSLQQRWPQLQFRKVGVNLGAADEEAYMNSIKAATDDIRVKLLFNNAGFITAGFFSHVPFGRNKANFHCNATCNLPITHHFLTSHMLGKATPNERKCGLVAFTSSSANLFPAPLSSMYNSTKAFLSSWATSLAGEVRHRGVDVLVVHPSPVRTNFTQQAWCYPHGGSDQLSTHRLRACLH